MKITADTNYYVFKRGKWKESTTMLERTTYSPGYSIFPKDGDVYLRFNPEKNAIFCFVFNGKCDKFFDVPFGAGMEYHSGNQIDFNDFVKSVQDSDDFQLVATKLNKAFKKVEGFDLWKS